VSEELIHGVPAVNELAEARAKRQRSVINDGACFAFAAYDYDDEGIGFTEDKEKPIVVILDNEMLTGIAMNAHDAIALGTALIDAAREHMFPGEVEK